MCYNMGILDSYKDLINASFSKWLKVEDKHTKAGYQINLTIRISGKNQIKNI